MWVIRDIIGGKHEKKKKNLLEKSGTPDMAAAGHTCSFEVCNSFSCFFGDHICSLWLTVNIR